MDLQVRMHPIIDEQLWYCRIWKDLCTDRESLQFFEEDVVLLSFQQFCI